MQIALGLVVTAIVVALHLEYYRHAGPLWRDEVNSVNIVSGASVREALANRHLDSFPVAWTALMLAWKASGLGDSDAGLRLLGLLIGLATLATFWWTGRRLGVGAPLVTLLLLGMSPTAIVYGDEVRGYGLGTLGVSWFVGAIWAFTEQPGWRTYLVAQMAALLAAQAYFPNCFLLPAICGAAACVAARRRTASTVAGVFATGAVAAVSMLANLPAVRYASQVSAIEQGDHTLAWLVEVFRHALAPGVNMLAMLWPAACVLAALGCVRAWRSADTGRDLALFTAVMVPVGLVLQFGYLLYVARLPTLYWYYLPLMAVIALACDAGIGLLVQKVRGGEAGRAGGVLFAALLVAPAAAETVPLRMTNVDVIAKHLEQAARPEDLIVVVPWFCGITFERYFAGGTPWITVPDFEEHKFHLHLQVAEKMKRGDDAVAPELARIEQTLRAGGRVWLVGLPPTPPPGEAPPSLLPAPNGPQGWRAAPYLDAWEMRLGFLLESHGREVRRATLPAVGRVNAWENLPLTVVEGWR